MDFHSTITCQLEEDPIPAPEFVWNVTLNGIELPSDNVWYENGTLNLTGPITFDNTSIIYVICDVSNTFGDDIANTSIRLCGKLNRSLNLAVAIVSNRSSDDSNMSMNTLNLAGVDKNVLLGLSLNKVEPWPSINVHHTLMSTALNNYCFWTTEGISTSWVYKPWLDFCILSK